MARLLSSSIVHVAAAAAVVTAAAATAVVTVIAAVSVLNAFSLRVLQASKGGGGVAAPALPVATACVAFLIAFLIAVVVGVVVRALVPLASLAREEGGGHLPT